MRLIGLWILCASYLAADSGYFWLGVNYGKSGFEYENASGTFTSDKTETTGGKIGYQFGDQAILLEYDKPSLEDGEELELYLLDYRLIGSSAGWPLALYLDISLGQSTYSSEALALEESNEVYGGGIGFLLKFHEYVLLEGGYKSLTSKGLSENDLFNITKITLSYGALIIRF